MRGLLLLGSAALLLMAADAPPPTTPPTPPPPELTKTDATGVLSRMVHDADGREIGRIVDVVVDPSGQPRAIVIDVGGFMGVGARRVAVSWASVHVPSPGAKDESVGIDLTDAQVRAAPDYTDRSKPATIVGPPTVPAAAPVPEPPPTPAPEAPAAPEPSPPPAPVLPTPPEPAPTAPEATPPASPTPDAPAPQTPPEDAAKAGQSSK